MKNAFIGAVTVVALSLSVPAVAAAAPAFSWAGCHVGINGGAVINNSRMHIRRVWTPPGTPNPANLIAALTNDQDFDQTTGTVGGQIGCDWQSNAWVWGIEGDANWSGINQQIDTAFPIVPVALGIAIAARNQIVTDKVDWFSTIRGRVGFAAGRALFYGTGGVAFGHVKSTTTVQSLPVFIFPNPLVGSADSTRVGWTAGAGFEYALGGNWSVKAEYLYVDLGKLSYNVVGTGVAAGQVVWAPELSTGFHVARIGLNYRFGGPAVAKY
jgi:outer membrane immunogenic protein